MVRAEQHLAHTSDPTIDPSALSLLEERTFEDWWEEFISSMTFHLDELFIFDEDDWRLNQYPSRLHDIEISPAETNNPRTSF